MSTFERDAKKNEVRERTSIVEVVKRHVELKRAGTGSWKGLCPFHAEKTPSFHVNEKGQYFNCFGCGEKGDVFTFVMKIEGRSFREVLHDLAQVAGIELDERPMSAAERRAHTEAESEKQRMYRVMEMATRFFEEQYEGSSGAAARTYVEGRGITSGTRARFRVGYAPAGWSALEAFLAAEKVPMAVGEQLGLLGVNERGRYDFFRDRVMLPVIDRQKRPVGFSSRLLDPEAKAAKYVNSPDSPLFHKKEQLYGLHAAQDAIRKCGRAVLVEGNFDVMSLHEAGLEEAVAPMGTALTPEQVALLGRMAERIVVVFDGDEAGLRAARKVVPLFVDAGLDGRVARLPSGVDPDDFIRKEGADAWKRLVDGARPMVDQFVDDVAGDADLATIPGRVRALEEAAPLIARVKNMTMRELYAARLATTLQLAPAQVARALRAIASKPEARGPADVHPVEAPAADAARIPPRDELEVLALVAAHPTLLDSPEIARVLDLCVDPGVRQLLRAAQETFAGDARLDVPTWLDGGPADVRQAVGRVAMDGRYTGAEDPGRVLAALRSKLERLRIDAEIALMRRQHGAALARGDEETARAISIRELELIRTKQGLVNTERPST